MRFRHLFPILILLAACGGSPPPAEEPAVPAMSEGEALIERAIAYHDPGGVWGSAEIALRLRESRPNGDRFTDVRFGRGGGMMEVSRETDEGTLRIEVTGEQVTSRSVDGDSGLSEEALEAAGLGESQVMRLRNYYLYLYGLPMKLRDPGAMVAEAPAAATFDDQEALELQVAYDGGDTWYFYFHPETARLIGYRFYHDESANDGEYIHLAGEAENGGLRLPESRRWYFHSDDSFLGEDTIVEMSVMP